MSKRLTVVQTLPALNSGGVERGTLEIARALVEKGHRSIVVSSGGVLVEQLIAEGSEHITMPVHKKSLMSLFQIRPFRQMLQRINPDIVHARSRIPAWIAWLALRKMNPTNRPRFVTTVHGLYSVSPYSAIMARGERVILISKAVQHYVATHYPFCPESSQRLIYRGADTNDFPFGFQPSAKWLDQWQAEHPELAGKQVIGMIGRIAPIKGIDTLLDVMSTLREEMPSLHALVIGGAEPAREAYAQALREKANSLGLTERVHFIGQRNDVAEVLSQCDLLLSLRTTPEAFGRSTLEPLRLGKPVIGWDEGGVGEILQTIYPRGAVSPHDTQALVTRIREWFKESSWPTEHSEFRRQTMCDDTLAVYHELAVAKQQSR